MTEQADIHQFVRPLLLWTTRCVPSLLTELRKFVSCNSKDGARCQAYVMEGGFCLFTAVRGAVRFMHDSR